jgi:hypothetical protein
MTSQFEPIAQSLAHNQVHFRSANRLFVLLQLHVSPRFGGGVLMLQNQPSGEQFPAV